MSFDTRATDREKPVEGGNSPAARAITKELIVDPTENLREQLSIAAAAISDGGIDQDYVVRLAELVSALNDWIRHGGFLPAPWTTRTISGCR